MRKYDNENEEKITWTQLFMWSQAALAADMAELSFLAAITAAPRF